MPSKSDSFLSGLLDPVFILVSCLLDFASISFIIRQIILTLQFCKIYDDQVISILGFLAVGKKCFIEVLFFSMFSGKQFVSFLQNLYNKWPSMLNITYISSKLFLSYCFSRYMFWCGMLTRCSQSHNEDYQLLGMCKYKGFIRICTNSWNTQYVMLLFICHPLSRMTY